VAGPPITASLFEHVCEQYDRRAVAGYR